MDNKKIIEKKLKEIKQVLKPFEFDPNGSYTGLTEDYEIPIQDQDDL